jgi:hypothetical protein
LPPDPPSCPADLSAKSADYRPNPVDFRPVATDLVQRLTHHRARSIFALLPPIRFDARTEFAPGRFTGYLDRFPTDFLQCRQ